MDDASFKIQVRHLRSCIASLRLLNLDELADCAEQLGTDADKDLLAALILALETLPNDHH